MRPQLLAFVSILCSNNIFSFSTFLENPYSPYPAGCATLPDQQTLLYGENVVKFADQRITLTDASNPLLELDANVAAYRIACADSNRSVVWLAFTMPVDVPSGGLYVTPEVRAELGDNYYAAMSLAREPNSWDVGNEGWSHGQIFGGAADYENVYEKTWIFVLDNTSPFAAYFDPSNIVSAAQYNANFNLELNWRDYGGYVIEVPATANVLTANPGIPLSGRLSGNWVINGASDQGFVIAISEVVGDAIPQVNNLLNSPLLIFLSWYTFDSDGDLLWLTGATQFEMGDTEVTIPIEKVTNGEFMGSKTADRSTVGNVTITGNNCNDLSLQYDLTNIGLGSDTQHLQRLFSLETAGYACRDLEARILSK